MKTARLCVAILCAAAPLTLTAADFPSGESLLQKCLARSGGAAAYARVKSSAMTGTVELVGHNLTGPVSVFQQGDKTYTVIELPGIGKVEEGFDGTTAWEMNALQGARIKDGEEKSATVRASRMNLMGTWQEYYTVAKTVGPEDVAGKPAWRVELTPKAELTPKGGKPETFWFDRDSGLLVRMAQTVSSAMGEIPVDVSLSDYRDVGGIKTPFVMTQKAMSQVMVMHFEKVEWNPPLPPGRFDLPGSIQALLEQRK